MKLPYSALFAALITLLAGINPAFGWGQNGHRITAEIGQRNSSDHTARVINSIIGNQTLAEIATWPDDIRSESDWDFSQPWHFLSIDDKEDWTRVQRAAKDTGDVITALQTLEKFLSDPEADVILLQGTLVARDGSSSKQQQQVDKARALAFYVHFVGDIHQPLHVGRRDDFGGNKIEVNWFGEETNLHKVWDELLIASTELSFTELATFLNRVSPEDQQTWTSTSYLDWAKESKAIRDKVYDFGVQKGPYYLNVKESPVLKWGYRHETLPIIKSRLTKGGIRLAAKLDQIFYNYSKQY